MKNDRLISSGMIRDLRSMCPDTKKDVLLSGYSRWRIGGVADCVVSPATVEELVDVISYVRNRTIPYVIIGETSNLLFPTEGIRALVIHFGKNFSKLSIAGSRVFAQSGAWVPRFSLSVAKMGLGGTEHMIGIPGTLGGLIYMNGGSSRKGVGDHVVKVNTLSPEGDLAVFNREECGFQYRSSVFQSNGHIIISAEFDYPLSGDAVAVRRDMLRILRERRRKFPRKTPNCGSVFVSDPKMYKEYGSPGEIIERCGLKGLEKGNAKISELHANFILNKGAATAEDVLFLINLVQKTAEKETGYSMRSEVRYVTPFGMTVPAHERAAELYPNNFIEKVK